MPGLTVLGEIRHDLSYYRTKLEPMTRETGGNRHLWVIGVQVDQEVFVFRVGEHANAERHRWPVGVREVTRHEIAERLLVASMWLAIHCIGIHLLFVMMVSTDLESGNAENGEAVEMAFVSGHVEHRKGVDLKELRS